MVTELFANTIGSSAASTTLAGNSGGAITSGATTLKVASNNGFSVTGGQMRAVIEPGTANAEVVIITGIATLTFTVARGQEGTTAVAHNDGSVFIAEVTAGALGNMLQTPAGSDGQYFIRRSGLWVPDTPSYADLSGVPASFAPSVHATTHASGGSDPVTLAPAQVTGTAVVTADSRLSDTRTPTDGTVTDAKVNSSAAIAESKLSLASDAAAATASRRTLGTGSTQAAAGNDSRLTNARTPTAHASTHYPGGSDDVSAILRRTSSAPGNNGYTAQNFEPGLCFVVSTNFTPTAGKIYLTKVLTADAFTINNIDFFIGTGGSGVTALLNCFVGIYDSGGTRRFASSDQATSWGTAGGHQVAVSGGYLVTANDFVYIAFLIGTQSTTACQFKGLPIGTFGATGPAALNLTTATLRAATNLTSQSSLPTPTLTLANNTTDQSTIIWVGLH